MTIKENYSLKNNNTFLIDVKAKFYVEIENESEIVEFLESPKFIGEKKLLIGGGANILFTQDFDGVVYKLIFEGIEIIEERDDYLIIQANAGVDWDSLVKWSAEKNLYGLENLALIPGTAGAAPIQNIGAYGVEQKDCFISARYFDIEQKEFFEINADQCNFGYRDSIFKRELKNKAIITNVKYKLSKVENLNLSYSGVSKKLAELSITNTKSIDVYNAIVAIRNEKLPETGKIGSAGSFFKNPIISKEDCARIAAEYPTLPQYLAINGVKIAAAFLIREMRLERL